MFERFLLGDTLEECYEAVAEVANRWLDMLDTQVHLFEIFSHIECLTGCGRPFFPILNAVVCTCALSTLLMLIVLMLCMLQRLCLVTYKSLYLMQYWPVHVSLRVGSVWDPSARQQLSVHLSTYLTCAVAV